MKRCFRCKQELPDDQFYKHKRKKDGLSTYCKQCNDTVTRAYDKKHPDLSRYPYRPPN